MAEGNPVLIAVAEENVELQLPEDLVKQRQAYELHKLQGLSVVAIAKLNDVTTSTIYNWIKKEKDRYKQELEGESGVSLIMESMQWLDELKAMVMFESTQNDENLEGTVGKDGIVRKPSPSKGYTKRLQMWTLAKNIEALKLDLMKDTGVLPRAPEHIYHSIKDQQRAVDSQEKVIERSPEERKQNIIRLIEAGRSLV